MICVFGSLFHSGKDLTEICFTGTSADRVSTCRGCFVAEIPGHCHDEFSGARLFLHLQQVYQNDFFRKTGATYKIKRHHFAPPLLVWQRCSFRAIKVDSGRTRNSLAGEERLELKFRYTE